MPKSRLAVLTTVLDLVGVTALTVAGWLALGVAGVIGALGGVCLAASYSLSRRGSA